MKKLIAGLALVLCTTSIANANVLTGLATDQLNFTNNGGTESVTADTAITRICSFSQAMDLTELSTAKVSYSTQYVTAGSYYLYTQNNAANGEVFTMGYSTLSFAMDATTFNLTDYAGNAIDKNAAMRYHGGAGSAANIEAARAPGVAQSHTITSPRTPVNVQGFWVGSSTGFKTVSDIQTTVTIRCS